MPLQLVTPPANAQEVVYQAITTLPLTASILDSCKELDIAAPHPIYTMTPEDIRGRRRLTTALPAGWRYLLMHGAKALASVDLSYDPESDSTRLSHINHGPLARWTVQAIDAIESRDAFQRRNFDLRALHVPALSFEALWLLGESPSLGYIIPLQQGGQRLPCLRHFNGEVMLEHLRILAERYVGMNDEPVMRNERPLTHDVAPRFEPNVLISPH